MQPSQLTFSEHKVNGKSKGIAYVELPSNEVALVVKRWFESQCVPPPPRPRPCNTCSTFQNKLVTVSIVAGNHGNPFRTLPKEPGSSRGPTKPHVAKATCAPPPAASNGGAYKTFTGYVPPNQAQPPTVHAPSPFNGGNIAQGMYQQQAMMAYAHQQQTQRAMLGMYPFMPVPAYATMPYGDSRRGSVSASDDGRKR